MNEPTHTFYRHSGKFGIHGPLLALLAAVVIGFPLGILYAYLIKWIPFIYLNFFLTVGYGCAFGFMTGWLLKFGKVRSSAIAALIGLVVGMAASYFSWNGYVHAMVNESPTLITFAQLRGLMGLLYDNGSWGIGSSGTPVTGIPLAIVWFVEAAIIIGITFALAFGFVAQLPFCEQHGCWYDEERNIDKLDAFVMPEHLAALKAGDLSPLGAANPRVPASGRFARLILKHSAKCDDYCALCIENITITTDKEGNPQEKKESLLTNLLVPKNTFDYLLKSEPASAASPS